MTLGGCGIQNTKRVCLRNFVLRYGPNVPNIDSLPSYPKKEKQDSIPVGYVLSAFLVPWGLPNSPYPSPPPPSPPIADTGESAHPPDADPPRQSPPPVGRPLP